MCPNGVTGHSVGAIGRDVRLERADLIRPETRSGPVRSTPSTRNARESHTVRRGKASGEGAFRKPACVVEVWNAKV
jgi:hypothetical protein